MNAAERLTSEAEATLRKARKYTDATGGRLTAVVAGTKRKHQTGSSSKPNCPGCGSFDHAYAACVYRPNSYFNTDPSLTFAQSSTGIRYYNKNGGGGVYQRTRLGSINAQE